LGICCGDKHDEANQNEAFSLIKTSDGGYALAGYIVASGASDWNGWLVKTDSAGTAQWSQIYGSVKDDCVGCVVQTSDGGYVLAGLTNSTASEPKSYWLFKTDGNGVVPEFPASCAVILLIVTSSSLAAVSLKSKARKNN
jgi:hypothetical protein